MKTKTEIATLTTSVLVLVACGSYGLAAVIGGIGLLLVRLINQEPKRMADLAK